MKEGGGACLEKKETRHLTEGVLLRTGQLSRMGAKGVLDPR